MCNEMTDCLSINSNGLRTDTMTGLPFSDLLLICLPTTPFPSTFLTSPQCFSISHL